MLNTDDLRHYTGIDTGYSPEMMMQRAADEIDRLRYQVEIGQQVVNFGVGLMTTEQVGQWVGVRHFLEAGTEMYPPFPDDAETPNLKVSGPEGGLPPKGRARP